MQHRNHTRSQPLYLRDGRFSSLRLEPVFFKALRMIGYRRGLSMADVIRELEGYPRHRQRSLASVLRCYAMEQMLPHYPLTVPPSPHGNARAQPKRRA